VTIESQSSADPHYRREIDGLRAVAVLAVVAYHAGLPGVPGGYVGVDIFFVISGYLITAILLRQLDSGRFSLAGFWLRRARRILPALLALLAGCLMLALLVMMPDGLVSFGESLGAGLFVANFYFWRQAGDYFGDPAQSAPLLHLWSLAVEEQYYLLYPPVLALLWRLGRKGLVVALGAAALASLALCEAMSHLYPVANFFLLPTRAWELLAGALLAAGNVPARATRFSLIASNLLSLLGAALILAPIALLSEVSRFPGIAALPPVLGAMLLIALATPRTLAGRVLGHPAAVGVGLISYSLYLWHLPLLVLARMATASDRLPAALTATLIVTSFALAWASWRWIEQPFRRGLWSSRRFLAASAGVALFFLACIPTLRALDGLPGRFPPNVVALLDLRRATAEQARPCMLTAERAPSGNPACLRGDGGAIRFAFVGDSHAWAVAPAFDALLAARGARAMVATVSACAPVLDDILEIPDHGGCTSLHRRTLRFLLAHPEIDTVVLAARWPYYLERADFDNGEGGVERNPMPPLDRARRAAIGRAYGDLSRALLAAGRRVILVYPVPEAGWTVPDRLARRRAGWFEGEELSVARARVEARTRASVEALDRIGTHPNLLRLYPVDALCGAGGGTRCRLEYRGAPLYFDQHHLTALGARLALQNIVARYQAQWPD